MSQTISDIEREYRYNDSLIFTTDELNELDIYESSSQYKQSNDYINKRGLSAEDVVFPKLQQIFVNLTRCPKNGYMDFYDPSLGLRFDVKYIKNPSKNTVTKSFVSDVLSCPRDKLFIWFNMGEEESSMIRHTTHNIYMINGRKIRWSDMYAIRMDLDTTRRNTINIAAEMIEIACIQEEESRLNARFDLLVKTEFDKRIAEREHSYEFLTTELLNTMKELAAVGKDLKESRQLISAIMQVLTEKQKNTLKLNGILLPETDKPAAVSDDEDMMIAPELEWDESSDDNASSNDKTISEEPMDITVENDMQIPSSSIVDDVSIDIFTKNEAQNPSSSDADEEPESDSIVAFIHTPVMKRLLVELGVPYPYFKQEYKAFCDGNKDMHVNPVVNNKDRLFSEYSQYFTKHGRLSFIINGTTVPGRGLAIKFSADYAKKLHYSKNVNIDGYLNSEFHQKMVDKYNEENRKTKQQLNPKEIPPLPGTIEWFDDPTPNNQYEKNSGDTSCFKNDMHIASFFKTYNALELTNKKRSNRKLGIVTYHYKGNDYIINAHRWKTNLKRDNPSLYGFINEHCFQSTDIQKIDLTPETIEERILTALRSAIENRTPFSEMRLHLSAKETNLVNVFNKLINQHDVQGAVGWYASIMTRPDIIKHIEDTLIENRQLICEHNLDKYKSSQGRLISCISKIRKGLNREVKVKGKR